MSLASAQSNLTNAILNLVNADKGNASQAASDLSTAIYNFVTAATVTVPATGLVSGTAGSPVTGQASGSLS